VQNYSKILNSKLVLKNVLKLQVGKNVGINVPNIKFHINIINVKDMLLKKENMKKNVQLKLLLKNVVKVVKNSLNVVSINVMLKNVVILIVTVVKFIV